VARVALLSPDLLFGSKVEGGLRAAGHEVARYDREAEARAAAADVDVLVVDLTAGDEPAALVASMRAEHELDGVATLAFYSHVDQDTRRRAEEAGFDLVVPRSRMAREGAALLQRLSG
jgi:DNA-binding response OmpR family regulator